jgi:hypothetical protein
MALEGLSEQLIVLNQQASRSLFQYRGHPGPLSPLSPRLAWGKRTGGRRGQSSVTSRVALFNFGSPALVVFVSTPVRLTTYRTPSSPVSVSYWSNV